MRPKLRSWMMKEQNDGPAFRVARVTRFIDERQTSPYYSRAGKVPITE